MITISFNTKNFIIGLLLTALIAVSIYSVIQNNNSTDKIDELRFTIEDDNSTIERLSKHINYLENKYIQGK